MFGTTSLSFIVCRYENSAERNKTNERYFAFLIILRIIFVVVEIFDSQLVIFFETFIADLLVRIIFRIGSYDNHFMGVIVLCVKIFVTVNQKENQQTFNESKQEYFHGEMYLKYKLH